MRVSTLATFVALSLLLSGCQLPYLMSGAVEQVKILRARKPIKKAISSGKLTETEIEKLKYSEKASAYAEEIGLNCKKNFKTYVKLDRKYVSYVVIASEKEKLKLKKWKFPFFGAFPYLGFFSEKKARKFQEKLIKKDYDTYLRGASAYSSLGWFNEPILSSMIRGSKESLAETIFHECFHGTFFAKSNVALNEQLAVFIAHKALLSFLEPSSKLYQSEVNAWQDQQAFSEFLKTTLKDVKNFYSSEESKDRELLFEQIRTKYKEELLPKLKVLKYSSVFDDKLNNAKLLAFKTYFHNFDKLEVAFTDKFNSDVKEMIYYFFELQKLSTKKALEQLATDKIL